MAQMTPRELEIKDEFIRHLIKAARLFKGPTQASRHGESDPEFAKMFDEFTTATADATPEEVAQVLQTMLSAAIATVNHFLESETVPQ